MTSESNQKSMLLSHTTTYLRRCPLKAKATIDLCRKGPHSHLDDEFDQDIVQGQTQLQLRTVCIACQDATAQMSLIQFMPARLDTATVPTAVHCDHLLVSRDWGKSDLARALEAHREVYDFMESACQKYKMALDHRCSVHITATTSRSPYI
ncbi:hypothetical protein BJX99DRAFT_257228 [Aspergillus californicus]